MQLASRYNLLKNIFFVGLGSLLTFTVTFLFAKNLEKNEYGTFVTLTSVSSILISIACMGVGDLIVKYWKKDQSKTTQELLIVFLIQYIIASGLGIGFTLFDKSYLGVLLITTLLPLVQILSSIARADSKFILASILSGGIWPIALIISHALLFYIFNINNIITILITTNIIILIIIILVVFRYSKKIEEFIRLKFNIKKYIMESITVGLIGVLFTLIMNTDVIFIKTLYGLEETANYKITSITLQFMLLPHIAINMMAGPRLVNMINNENNYQDVKSLLDSISKSQLKLCIIVILLIPILYEFFLNIYFSNKYEFNKELFIIFSMIGLIFSMLGSSATWLVICNCQRQLLYVYILIALINILLNYILQRKIGLIGAPISLLISMIVMYFIINFLVKKNFRNLNSNKG